MNKISTICLSTLLGCSSFYALANNTVSPNNQANASAPTEQKAVEQPKTEKKATPMSLKKIAPYPEATAEQKRYVIFLDPKENEELYKVELVIGKTIEVDACNQYMIGGTVEQKILKGFGYSYYEVEQVGMPASTLMACQDDSKHQEFIPMSPQTFSRYNSKLPIVVYAPKDVEVRYRIWSASDKTELAEIK